MIHEVDDAVRSLLRQDAVGYDIAFDVPHKEWADTAEATGVVDMYIGETPSDAPDRQASVEESDQRRLWEVHLPYASPRDDDLDLDLLAKAFELSGGDIRNVTLAAAYAAAVDGGQVSTAELVRASTGSWGGWSPSRSSGRTTTWCVQGQRSCDG